MALVDDVEREVARAISNLVGGGIIDRPRTQQPAVPPKANESQRLTVDLRGKTLTLDGVVHKVPSERALRWVRILAEHANEWISSADLEKFDPELLTTRTDRLKKGLPAELRTLIESQTGAGSILRL